MTQSEAQARLVGYHKQSQLPYVLWHRPSDNAWCILQGRVERQPGIEGQWIPITGREGG